MSSKKINPDNFVNIFNLHCKGKIKRRLKCYDRTHNFTHNITNSLHYIAYPKGTLTTFLCNFNTNQKYCQSYFPLTM